jgi:hypothetical protein
MLVKIDSGADASLNTKLVVLVEEAFVGSDEDGEN